MSRPASPRRPPPLPLEAPYTLRAIESMLGLARHVVVGLIEAGVVTPQRGARNEFRFTFQDVVLLRTAHHLRTARIPPRRVLLALKQLRARLPAALPLAGLRIRAVGNDVAVRRAGTHWEAGDGQLLMDFEVASVQGAVAFLAPPAAEAAPASAHAAPRRADDWFREAERLEPVDPARAEAAYRAALAADPGHAAAALNLGALLCEAGRGDAAVAVCDDALRRSPDCAPLHYNLAIALEDVGRLRDALCSYAACLRLDPDLADAHFNAARLHERLGERREALRHYNAYRRLVS